MPKFNAHSKSKASLKALCASAVLLALSSSVVEAGKPKGAKNAAPKAVIQLYAGTTTEWTNGWAYWAPDGNFRVYWKNRDTSYTKYSVAVGKWTVDGKGKRCHQATWHARKKGSKTTEEIKGGKQCRVHVVDGEGNIWVQDHHKNSDKEWWEIKYEADKTSKGEIKKSAFRALAKKFGVSY